MNASFVIIALGLVASATYLLRRLIGSAPPNRSIDVGEVSANWLIERRKDAPSE
ncbi:MAG TPA: hypothetical protein VGQ10_19690 [Vicinamibacterales bacterium]|jgi:hypothetical protein|nr:hypothetical protein [Vicinamibacterales bacterium]